VTIRRILLFAFLAVGLLPAVALTVLAFTRARDALRTEIDQSLAVQAATVAADLDKMLFERLQNAATWNHLEVMQDLHVGDVDKRVSSFLSEMKLRYGGVYTELHAIDSGGHVAASSVPAAIGSVWPAMTAWQRASLPGGTVLLQAPTRRGNDRPVVAIHAAISSQFTDGALGELVSLMDWGAVEQMLDAAGQDRRALLVVDPQGAIVAATRAFRDTLPGDLRLPPEWLQARTGGVTERAAAPLPGGRVMVGSAIAPGYDHFSGFGWTTLVLQPVDEALLPVKQMAVVFLGLLLATAAVIVLVAGLVSARIARPVVALTDYTRRFTLDQHAAIAPPPAMGEVGELRRAFIRMVEDLERSRQTLVQASKLAAVGEFAAVMAHEIRTPLGILRSSAQMLERDPATTAEARELVGFISSETQRLNKLVSAMLDSARARAPVRSAQNVEALAERCLAMLAHQAQKQNVEFVRQFGASDPIAEVDGEQLTQVFLNLLMNALQVLDRGGRISVSSRNEAQHLVIEIADNGPGIPAAERSRIFEPFVYRREGGLGLGLAVVRQIVKAHAGDIVADESPAGGACFRIRLPQSASQTV
jgi:signal transduction histidine kinase